MVGFCWDFTIRWSIQWERVLIGIVIGNCWAGADFAVSVWMNLLRTFQRFLITQKIKSTPTCAKPLCLKGSLFNLIHIRMNKMYTF